MSTYFRIQDFRSWKNTYFYTIGSQNPMINANLLKVRESFNNEMK